MTSRSCLFLSAALLLTPGASAQSSINPTAKHAYGANTGWINLRPSAANGVVVTETFLSGYAYAANFGWLNFGWAAAADANRPRLDLLTGAFSGFAWSANAGWINLGSGSLKADTLVCIDSDGDGIADSWERQNFGNLTTANRNSDRDRDGVSDHDEYFASTDPNDARSWLRLTKIAKDPNPTKKQITFTSSPKRLYRLETSTDGINWSDSGLGTFVAGGSTTTKTVTHAAGPKRFFRAVAIKPLQP